VYTVDRPIDGEMRNVDDQTVWLDDGHVLYALPEVRWRDGRVDETLHSAQRSDGESGDFVRS
jgi:hypothetical protein